MSLIDAESYMHALNKNPEFLIAARFWNAKLKFGMGETRYMVTVADGTVTRVDPSPGLMEDWDFDFFVTGPLEEWEKLLEPVPRPFYQALLPAVLLGGLDFGGDFETFCAYYRAFSRMVEVMRSHRVTAS